MKKIRKITHRIAHMLNLNKWEDDVFMSGDKIFVALRCKVCRELLRYKMSATNNDTTVEERQKIVSDYWKNIGSET